MEEEEFARVLLSSERREWQDPVSIVEQLGIKGGMIVADLGCGPGFFTVPIARKVGTTGRVYAVDSSKMMLSHLKSNLERSKIDRSIVGIIETDLSRNTGIPRNSVDVVLLANVIHDLRMPEKVLKEATRFSKKGAVLVDIDWKKKLPTEIGPPVEIRLTKEESKRILSKNGYKTKSTIDAGRYHYGLICRRT